MSRQTGEPGAEVADKKMQTAQPVVVRAKLAGGAERGLEVVVFFREVVPVVRRLGFLQGGEAVGIEAAVIHVVAGQVAAGAELGEDDGLDVAGIDADAAVVAAHHAAAEFAGEEGVAGGVGGVGGRAFAEQVGGDGGVGAQRGEAEAGRVKAGHGREVAIPKTLGVGAVERQEFAEGQGRGEVGPAGAGVERGVEADLAGEALQGEEVFGGAAVFVLDLKGDDGAALFPEQAVELGGDGEEVAADSVEVGGGVGAGGVAEGFNHPVRQAAVADLAVAPGAEANDHAQADRGGGGDEATQIAVAGPVAHALDLLVVDPENIGRDGVDPAGFHLE